MKSFTTCKLQGRYKNTDRGRDDARYTPKSAVNRFERILDRRITRSAKSSWCRACLSNDCCLDASEQATSNDESEEDNFRGKLTFLKQKRASTEAYIDHLDKINTSCRLRIVSQPYVLSQDHLPPWLTGVSEHGLCIPIVPAFPTSKQAIAELVSALDLQDSGDAVLRDYECAALYARRVRLGVVCKSQPRRPSVCLLNQHYFLCEEITDGSMCTDTGCENDVKDGRNKLYFSHVLAGSRANERIKIPRSINKTSTSNNIRYSNHGTSIGTSSTKSSHTNMQGVLSPEDDLQQVESLLTWVPRHTCSKAVIQECSSERIVITGEFPTDPLGNLQFTLVIFPGERVGRKHMRLTGTFLRSAERSHYKLKWKYDIHIPVV